jgi:formate-dependent nitrite reductase membrane component NrfD
MEYLDAMIANDSIDPPAARHSPRGILFWETIAKYELDAYRRAWGSVRMEQLNAEVVVIAHQQARLIRSKYAALQWLFRGLAVLLVLAGALLAVYAGFGLAG